MTTTQNKKTAPVAAGAAENTSAEAGANTVTNYKYNIDKDFVKSNVNLLAYAKSSGLEPVNGHTDRFPCPWRPGADSNGFKITSDGYFDHVEDDGGDCFKFVMKLHNMEFQDALKHLAEWAGIASATGPKIVKTYDYLQENGELLFEVVRYEPKSFKQRRPDPDNPDQWLWKKSPVQVPYRSPELIKSDYAIIAAGEKDVDNLRELGLVATTNAGGEGKWPEELTQYFQGKSVLILADNDDAGQRHAEKVARALQGTAKNIKTTTPCDKFKGADVTDWLAEGNGKDELFRLWDNLPEWGPQDLRSETSPENAKKGGRKKVDYAGIANSYADSRRDEHGRLCLRFHRGMWFEYSDGFYRDLPTTDLKSDVMRFIRQKYQENETRNTVDNVIANLMASDLCGLPSRVDIPTWLDTGEPASGWLPMKNKIVNVPKLAERLAGKEIPDSEVFREHTPELFTTFGQDYQYDEAATCPNFISYLKGVQPDEGDRKVLQMLAGLALIPETRFNVFFVLYGEPGTGKSVFLHVLRYLAGVTNCCCLPLTQFDNRFSSWMLTTNLLNIVGELPTESASDHGTKLRHVEGMLKDVTDGGLVPVEHKHQEPTQAAAIARNIFATNSLPRFADRSGGVWDRLRIIPFEQRFRGTAQENPRLRFEITEKELPGVFMWAAEGLGNLLKLTSFPEHSGGIAAKEEHRRACDPERVFIEETFAATDDDYYYIETRQAFSMFKMWLEVNGYKIRTEHTFANAMHRVLRRRKIRKQIAGKQKVIYPKTRVINDEEYSEN